MVELQQEAGAAAPSAVRIDVTAAAAVAEPHLAPHGCGDVAGSARPVGLLRAASGAAGGRRPRARTAIERRRTCRLRWRRSVATAIRRCQRGRPALIRRRRRPWRRYGAAGPTVCHRLRRRSSGAGRRRGWPGTHRGDAASLAPRRRSGPHCRRRSAGVASPAPGFLCGQRCRRRSAATGARAFRRRHSGLLLRFPLRRRSPPARRPIRRLRLRCLALACLTAPTSAPAPRVVALQAVLDQPLHELPRASGAGPRATAVPEAARSRADRRSRSPPSAPSGRRPEPAGDRPAAPAREPPRPTTASPRGCSCRSPAPPAPAAAPWLRNERLRHVPGPAPGREQVDAGGVRTGLEGVAGCSKGRRGRNVRQGAVTSSAKPVKCSAHFFATFSHSPAPRCRRGRNASTATGVAGGRHPPIPGHIVQLRTAGRVDSGRVEPRPLKVAIWPTPGRHRGSATHGMQTSFSMGRP